MNEISKVIAPDEKIIYQSVPSYTPYMISALFAIVIVALLLSAPIMAFSHSITLAVLAGVCVFILGIIICNLSYKRTAYAITDKRLVIQSGIIGRDFKSIDYDKIQNVSVSVGILGVIFHVGTIQIFTGEMEAVNNGQNGTSMQSKFDKFLYVTSPYDTLKQLQTELSKRKEKLS